MFSVASCAARKLWLAKNGRYQYSDIALQRFELRIKTSMNSNELSKNIDIRVISLRESSLRRERIAEQMKYLGLDFSFFDGMNPREMDHKRVRELREIHDPFPEMTISEFGCDLSHYYLVKDWLETSERRFLLVLEDDAEFSKPLLSLLQSQCHEAVFFDILKVGGVVPKRKRVASEIHRIEGASLVYPFDPSFCAVGYIVNRERGQRILTLLENFFVQVDVRLFKHFKPPMAILETAPFLVVQSGAESTISHSLGTISEKKVLWKRLTNDFGHAKRTLSWALNYARHYGLPRKLVRI
jgi:GR25 family glycosyltransferase involved in LPS biosynthesis